MKITVANAPISYGAFELTVGIDPNTPNAEFVLNEVARAGYAGIDLGPVGYLGTGPVLVERLASRNLGLAGAYLEFPFTDPEGLEALYPELDAMLDTFDIVRDTVPGPLPHPTIADASGDARRLSPGQSHSNPSLGLSNDDWKKFEVGLKSVLARCRDRGYEPTFHPETGTFVEATWEIERVLEISDVGLCLETGHIFVCGGDPLALLRSAPERVNHVHLKDASRSRMDGVIADYEPTPAIWTREVFRALGDGDVDLDGVLAELERLNFEGWLVVEQDIFPQTADRFAQAVTDQKNNRQFLASRGI
ncbi:MAG TPA: TIM barrel protein [Acidimicrobiales bacterium]|nr:TIM barrel protein [Acidimicrobiales bacterium]